jgi:pyruvate/2-oxoglutarate dehydrogenase complex dihydrolipoamide dehydrogenase (E3) component
MPEVYDFCVIGGGSAGYAAARTALEYTHSVAVIDGAETLGGLCILRGCMPSKTLIYSAEVLHLARKAKLFGLDIPEAAVEMAALHARKLRHIEDFASYRQGQLTDGRFTLYRAKATFTGPDTLTLSEGTTLRAKKLLIATGSSVQWPAVPGLRTPGIWTSDDVLDLDTLPESVAVLGGGIVACELAQFLQRCGSRVTLIQRSENILKEQSKAASATITDAMRKEGMEIFTGTELDKIERLGDSWRVHYKQDGSPQTVDAAHVFNALGRRPNVEGLGCEAAGIELSPSGHILTDPLQQTSSPNIWAAGDVAGPHEIVHVAILQAEVAVRSAFGQPTQPVDYRDLSTVVFTDPQIARVGLSEAALNEQKIQTVCADYPFEDHGKSLLMEAPEGYVKVWAAKPSGQVLAAECVGKDASELIHSMAVAVTLKASVHDLLKVHWYHPTLSEIWTYPLEDCAEALAEDEQRQGNLTGPQACD